MRAPRVRGLLGAGLAILAWATVVGFPRPIAHEPRPAPAPGGVAEPGPAAAPPKRLVERIGEKIAARMPLLDDDVRERLAATIVLEANAASIDPLLVLALIEVESRFDPEALSGRGALGLMQLREPTLRREIERHGLDDDLGDPVTNVQAGVRYLRRLLDAFGREEIALMAYNAGPNRILGYLREGEIPQRFHAYPRRVRAEVRRLRRSLGQERAPAVASEAAPAPVGG